MARLSSPYAQTLGLTLDRSDGRTIVTMAPDEGVRGRPGFLHGGAISGLLDHTAWVVLLDALEAEARIKPIGITIDFMRGGKMEPAYASAHVERLGRRVANVIATAWQDDEAKPIARADLKFLIER
ncbi:MAG: PaaI family thioesterase [Sphingomonadales bacterium]